MVVLLIYYFFYYIFYMIFPKSLLDDIAQSLSKRKEKIAIAESVTSGFIQFAFSQMEKASAFFSGGITTYTLEEKVRLLGVNRLEAQRTNCVSQLLSETMAKKVSALFDTDWSLAITGYARPVPESDEQLYAYYAISYQGQILSSGILEGCKELLPEELQYIYCVAVLEFLCDLLRN